MPSCKREGFVRIFHRSRITWEHAVWFAFGRRQRGTRSLNVLEPCICHFFVLPSTKARLSLYHVRVPLDTRDEARIHHLTKGSVGR